MNHGWSPGRNFQMDGDHTFNHTHPMNSAVQPKRYLPLSTKIQFLCKL